MSEEDNKFNPANAIQEAGNIVSQLGLIPDLNLPLNPLEVKDISMQPEVVLGIEQQLPTGMDLIWGVQTKPVRLSLVRLDRIAQTPDFRAIMCFRQTGPGNNQWIDLQMRSRKQLLTLSFETESHSLTITYGDGESVSSNRLVSDEGGLKGTDFESFQLKKFDKWNWSSTKKLALWMNSSEFKDQLTVAGLVKSVTKFL